MGAPHNSSRILPQQGKVKGDIVELVVVFIRGRWENGDREKEKGELG